MRPLLRNRRAALWLLALALVLFGALLPVGETAARFAALAAAQSEARAAAFGVEIVPPDGVQTVDGLAGGRNTITQPHTQSTEQVFTIRNNGEVTVLVTPAVHAQNDDAWVLDTSPFVLKVGEWRELSLTLEGGTAALETTVEEIDLVLTVEQFD